MKHFVRWAIAGIALLGIAGAVLFGWRQNTSPTQETLKIAIPYQESLFFINDSDYTSWLSEQIGQPIEFVFLQPNYTDNYLKQILANPDTDYDAVFFTQSTAPSEQELTTYIASGGVAALDGWIDSESVYLATTLAEFTDYDLRQEITYTDGHIYYVPALDVSSVSQSAQTMWINVSLLEEVGLQLPTTTEEFAQVLAAFASYDETLAPIIGTTEDLSYFPLYFLMNAFVTCDTQNHFLYLEDGTICFAPTSDAWRAGLQYCSTLYQDGLIPAETFTYSTDAFIAICNDPDHLVGCFVTDSIASVLSENSPALLSRYLAVSPLDSGTAAPVALTATPLPRVGGIVLAASEQQEAVFTLMDVMCSEEGYLRGHYGTPEVDWTNAAAEDITVNGDKAAITVTQSVGTISDTSGEDVIGPYIASIAYADMVAWKGYQVNQSAYLDARAYRTYEYYAPAENLPYLQIATPLAEGLDELVLDAMIAFVTGEWDVNNDEDWQAYLNTVASYPLDIADLTAQAQQLYNESEKTT